MTPQQPVDVICSVRKGSMDDKQFRATVEHILDKALSQQREEIELRVQSVKWLPKAANFSNKALIRRHNADLDYVLSNPLNKQRI